VGDGRAARPRRIRQGLRAGPSCRSCSVSRQHARESAEPAAGLHRIEDLGYAGQFADQEIEGLFVAFDGLVYTFDGSTEGHLKGWDGASFGRTIGGIDWGYTNPADALVVGLDGDRRA